MTFERRQVVRFKAFQGPIVPEYRFIICTKHEFTICKSYLFLKNQNNFII